MGDMDEPRHTHTRRYLCYSPGSSNIDIRKAEVSVQETESQLGGNYTSLTPTLSRSLAQLSYRQYRSDGRILQCALHL